MLSMCTLHIALCMYVVITAVKNCMPLYCKSMLYAEWVSNIGISGVELCEL